MREAHLLGIVAADDRHCLALLDMFSAMLRTMGFLRLEIGTIYRPIVSFLDVHRERKYISSRSPVNWAEFAAVQSCSTSDWQRIIGREYIMNPDDLIHAAPAIAKGAAALGAAIPFTAIMKRMLGPAADEVAEMWRDQVRMYRAMSAN